MTTFHTRRGRFAAVLAVAALPRIILIGVSIVAFLVSLLALLLLTVPIYRLLQAICGAEQGVRTDSVVNIHEAASGPRRHVDVTIVE